MDESVCDGLPIIRVKRDGSRIFDPQAKSRLVEACLQPGVSIASLALSHGVNANLLHKWIRRDRRAREKGVMKDGAEKLSAFVPVIQNKSAPAIRERPACMPALSQSTRKWPDPAKPSRLNAYLPNGARLTLECLGQDAELVCAMFQLAVDLQVYLHREAVDFRKGINGLAALGEQSLQRDPFARAVYAFSNRRRDRVKLLLWDRNGFWLLTKRLEADRFMWPRQQAVLVLTIEQLHWLLEGIDIEAMRRHPWRAYRRVS